MKKEFSLNSFKRIIVINKTPNRYDRNAEDDIKTAYVGNADDQKQIDTGLCWAGDSKDNKAEVKYFDNDNFTLEIKSCPERSSQGGKLSFWMCKITSEDGYSFFTSINSLLLEQLLKETTFIKGVCQEKVVFVRNKSQLGVITKTGKLYQQLLNDEYIRNNPKKKTTEYQIGDILESSREIQTYLGYRYSYFDISDYHRDYHLKKVFVNIYIYKEPKQCYYYLDSLDWWTNEEKCSAISNRLGDSYDKDSLIITGHRNDIKTLDEYIEKNFNHDCYKNTYEKELFNYRIRKTPNEKLDIEKIKELTERFYQAKFDRYPDWHIDIKVYENKEN